MLVSGTTLRKSRYMALHISTKSQCSIVELTVLAVHVDAESRYLRERQANQS